MLANYGPCEDRILVHEGGYSNDAGDPGGPTKYGITIFDARKYAAEYGWISGRTITADDVKAMPLWFAKKVWKTKYWDALRCDDLPGGVDDSVFDYGGNSGIGRSGKVLRRVLGLPDNDWRVTDQVIAAITLRDLAKLINAINDERMRFLRSLSTFSRFGNGWTRRVTEVRAFSLALAAGKAPALPASNDNVQKAGKGHVSPPPNTKPVKTGGAVVTTAATGGFGAWLHAHPEVPAAIIVVGAAVTIFIVNRIEASHKAKQEAPTPGVAVVPVKQAA